MEDEQGGSKRKPPSCSRCSNHGKEAPLTHHKCPYEECDCLLCKLTWARKVVMRKQQQLWRQRKETQKWEEAAAEAVSGGGAAGGAAGGGGGGDGDAEEGGSKQREKYCDMCRNHGVLVRNRGHKRACKYESCPCQMCTFTRKRRQIMQLQQKVKRSKITTQQFEEATEWVTKLTAELANLGIDDVPMPTIGAPSMPPPANIPPHSHYAPHSQPVPHSHPHPPVPQVESSYPVNLPPEMYSAAPPADPYPSSSCGCMQQRYFMSMDSIPSSEEYPPSQPPYLMDAGASCSSSATPPGAAAAVPGPSHFMPGHVKAHMTMDSSASFASLCPPSPSCPSLPASPLSDYDPTYPGCPSPLLPYYYTENPGQDMTSVPQQQCSMIRNTQTSEPLDCSGQQILSSRSQKHAQSRLQEDSEIPSILIKQPLHRNPQNQPPGSGNEHQDISEMAQRMYLAGQRRKSEGVIQPTYQHSQRRNSDSILQGIIYRPSQRRNSDGVIKKIYGQSQRGASDTVIQESQIHDDREGSEDSPQKHLKTDPVRDTSDRVAEDYHPPEKRIQNIYQLDQRRNSDGVIMLKHKLDERRNSDGVIRRYCPLNQRATLDKLTQNPMLHPSEREELIQGSYRQMESRSSDEISQDSSVYDHRRGSVDFPPETYGLSERRNSEDTLRSYYWPYPRSDSGETIPEDSWLTRRRDSDELSQPNYPLNTKHFFEDTLRREHEALERISKTVPITDANMDYMTERSIYIPVPPLGECQHVASAQEETSMPRQAENVSTQQNVMNWSSLSGEGEEDLCPAEEDIEEMEGPLDLTTRSSKRD